MRIIDDIASNQFALKSFASFQLIFFTSSLGRLNFYSPRIYETIAAVLANDIKSVNDADMLGTLLFPFERAAARSENTVKLVDQVIEKAIQLISRKNGIERGCVRGSLIVAYCSVSLDESKVHDCRVWKLVEHVVKNTSVKNMADRDYRMLYRLRAVADAAGIRSCPVFPEWIETSDHFRWYEPSHSVHVDNILKGLDNDAKLAGLSSFSDIKLLNGTQILVQDPADTMYSWSDPSNDKNYELQALPTNGSVEMLRGLLAKQGVTSIQVLHHP
jgi:hypothetical protein